MHAKVSGAIAVAIAIGLGAPRISGASPITYDFTGTLNQPVDGSTRFSGTFTIDSVPNTNVGLIFGEYAGIGEDGAAVSLSLRLGSQTISYVNTSQNPDGAFFSGVASSLVTTPGLASGQSSVDYAFTGYSQPSGGIDFGMSLAETVTNPPFADLTSLNSPSFTSSVSVSYDSGGQTQTVQGTITSMDLVSAPEPGMMTVFGLLAVAGIAHRRYLRNGKPESTPR